MQLKGIIKLIKPIQQISATFSKREFVIETQENYPQTIQLELQGDRVDIIDSFAEGQEIEAHLNIKGRLWVSPQGEEKYFNTIVCWKITASSSESLAPIIPPANDQNFMPIPNMSKEEEDKLPF